MAKGEKRQVTLINLQLVLDNQVVLGKFNQLCVPGIKKACLLGGEKYAPEVIVEDIEFKELEVIKK